MAALAVQVVQDLPPEALEEILLHSLKVALVWHCVRLHAMAALVALDTPEMPQPIQLAVQAALL